MTDVRVATEKEWISLLEAQVRKLTEEKNAAYAERNKVVAALAHVCFAAHGLPVKVAQHVGADWEDDWRTVLFIQLPTGQVSWHFHDSELAQLENLPHDPVGLYGTVDHPTVWDGHTTEEKYRRLAAWLEMGKTP